MKVHVGTRKVPAIRVIEEDINHRAFHITYITEVRPELHLEQQRHATIPCIVEGQFKVLAATSVERPWRDEEDVIHPCCRML
jgi:hypothetical protein